ncbi:hypothetical protein IQ246_12625 [aff. Roholtiella sp. LEGE 12411]|uniref:hypothetical protein n=1 Tax=aff. Roholtiella sp. LEGE 12411 TaxID=1828822 RepID=UPI0018817296|nr:hypothetical protein [aff. Roholtiella sp. LEGE 12411]MBE9035935.1 hypothetical protein [aff. Roholtiella sp. LEGE 12411]
MKGIRRIEFATTQTKSLRVRSRLGRANPPAALSHHLRGLTPNQGFVNLQRQVLSRVAEPLR